MAYGKQYPGPQTPPVPRKGGATKLTRVQAENVAADLLGEWLNAVHGKNWLTPGNGTFNAKENQ